MRFAIGIIGIIGLNKKEKADPPGEKRKRKQIMPVLITIAALFAVQIYAPAFAGAWPPASDSDCVALKRDGGSGMLAFTLPIKLESPITAVSFKARETARH